MSLIRTYLRKEAFAEFKKVQKRLGLNEYKTAQLLLYYALKDPKFFEILAYVLKHKKSITSMLEVSLKQC
jgi:hypothetical protein